MNPDSPTTPDPIRSDPHATIRLPDESASHPASIGPYKILDILGEGGMGVVYLAQQTEPVKRRIALKVIKLGMDTKQVIARFEQERQALALMDHPHVAKVFDAGITDPASGSRPYFAMEHVKGVPITAYCDIHRLSITKRLDLFMQVCHAIQHAHQKGIIHRDIKPTNVMVTLAGGDPDDSGGEVPQVKVIDFGVAKAIDRTLTEKTIFTEHGQLLGTPEYMSPEQAEMTGLNIDTRTDIYSLGVLLYELLTGSLPFDATNLRSRAFAEIQRIIREEEPHKPSTRLSSLSHPRVDEDPATAASRIDAVADKRKTNPHTLTRTIRGDLDWIVMMTLNKDRTLRYSTASALAEDINRFLRHEPVMAGPPSAVYRTKKFIRRNRSLVTGVSAVLVVILAGGITTAILSFNLSQANSHIQVLLSEMGKTSSAMFFKYPESMKEFSGTLEARKIIAEEAIRHTKFLVDNPDSKKSLNENRIELARHYRTTGQIIGGWRGPNLNRTSEALEHFHQALKLNKQVATDEPTNLENRRGLARSHLALADMLEKINRRDEALDHYQQTIQICSSVLSVNAEDDQALKLAATAELEIGDIYAKKGEFDEADSWYQRSFTKRQKRVDLNPDDAGVWRSLTVGYTRVASLAADRGDYESARKHYAEVLTIRKAWLKKEPESTRRKRDVMLTHHFLANTMKKLDEQQESTERGDQVLHHQHTALDLALHLHAQDPIDQRPRRDLAQQQDNSGRIFLYYGHPQQATIQFQAALLTFQELARDYPANTRYPKNIEWIRQDLEELKSTLDSDPKP